MSLLEATLHTIATIHHIITLPVTSKNVLFLFPGHNHHTVKLDPSPCTKTLYIHQVTTMLATFKNDLFPGHNHLLTTGTDDHSLAGARAIIKVSGHQYGWLVHGYDLG